jgi:hypothetical protein
VRNCIEEKEELKNSEKKGIFWDFKKFIKERKI